MTNETTPDIQTTLVFFPKVTWPHLFRHQLLRAFGLCLTTKHVQQFSFHTNLCFWFRYTVHTSCLFSIITTVLIIIQNFECKLNIVLCLTSHSTCELFWPVCTLQYSGLYYGRKNLKIRQNLIYFSNNDIMFYIIMVYF